MYNFDLNDIKDVLPIEPGDYKAVIAEVTDGEESSKGNPMFILKYEIILPERQQGRTLQERVVVTEKTLWKVKEIYAAAGATRSDGTFPVPFEPENDLLGKVMYISVNLRRYQKQDGTYGEAPNITAHKLAQSEPTVVDATNGDAPF